MTYKENLKEIALRKITPIYRNVNTHKQINTKPINRNVKEIIKYMEEDMTFRGLSGRTQKSYIW